MTRIDAISRNSEEEGILAHFCTRSRVSLSRKASKARVREKVLIFPMSISDHSRRSPGVIVYREFGKIVNCKSIPSVLSRARERERDEEKRSILFFTPIDRNFVSGIKERRGGKV